MTLNPIGDMPVMVDGDVVSDSFAILMYLEEKNPQHPLLPSDLKRKAINYQCLSRFRKEKFAFFKVYICSMQHLANVNGCISCFLEHTTSSESTCTGRFPSGLLVTLTTWLEYLWKILFYLLLSIYRSTFEEKVGADEKVVRARTHIGKGFAALGKLLKDYAGKYATGDEVFPTQFPHLLRLHEAYSKLPAFQDAVPEKQRDTPSS
ncbi:glutathione S-transferase Z2 [Citrus sinensis]|nr:glutathione S-transferase Z2 [Citrus sinensis]